MKLSDLVDYLNLLELHSHEPDCAAARRALDSAVYTVLNHTIKFENLSQEIQDRRASIDSAFDAFNSQLTEIKQFIQLQIEKLQPTYYQNSSNLWEHEMYYETNEHILQRRMAIDGDSNILLRSRLRQYSDWRVPGMIIRPGLENFIEDLVPLDPLYIVDQAQELVAPAIEKFTLEYQRRLRVYHVNDYLDKTVLRELPDEQFGFIFAYNYFNYRPIEVIDRYLEACYRKLRVGGSFIFTFNDCDRAHGVALCERSFMCYTPGSEIQARAERHGFEVVERYLGLGDIAWFELRKPGTVSSLRGGQTLAKIVVM
jgi:hypothetical protein